MLNLEILKVIAIPVSLIIAYLLGSISPSIIIGKMKGIDIKKEGSGNAGTTNVLRTLGKKYAVITLIGDVLKGTIAVLVATLLCNETVGYVAAIVAFVGHVYPVFYNFKGGKGVATALGCILAINPMLALYTLLVAGLVVLLTKRMSVGSIMAAVGFLIMCFFMETSFLPFGTVIALLIIYKHKENIKRIINGEEPKMSFKK